MLSERLRKAMEQASNLPEIMQVDIAEQIEDLLAYYPSPPETISIQNLIGDDGSDAFFDSMMDALDHIGHSVAPTPPIEDF